MPRLILSPHLDDAVFSAFHTLDAGAIVATLCTALPPRRNARSNYDRLTCAIDPVLRYKERQAEDLAVAAAGGWKPIHCGLLDSPYRENNPDPGSIAKDIVKLIETNHISELWIPAGIGGHRDHVLTRSVGLRAGTILNTQIHLYADIPYATTFGWPGWITGSAEPTFLDIDAYWKRWLVAGVNVRSDATIHRLDTRTQDLKLKACMGYRTQFAVSESGPSKALSHPERICVEVSWQIS